MAVAGEANGSGNAQVIAGEAMPGDAAPGDEHAVRAGYVQETARLVRRRLNLTVCLFLGFVGLTVYTEYVWHPDRQRAVVVVYVLETAACLATLVAANLGRLRDRVVDVAAGMACALAFLLSAYNAIVRMPPETLAIADVCLLTGVAVLLPWGWRAQAVVCLAAFVGFAAARLWSQDLGSPYPWIAVLTGATTSIWGAFFLDRHRYEAFVRTAELAHASAVQQGEAQIASALAHVGETLSSGMGRQDLFGRVNRLAVDLLGCDWSTTFVFDEQRSAFRFCSNVGSRAEVVAELASLEFPRGALPLFDEFRRGELVELSDADTTPFVPPELSRRWDVASALYAPIWRGGQLVGVLVSGYTARRGPFTARQHRLALGIANATAIALENERLVEDLQAANRLKSEFVSTMSHELRTPLNVITGYAEMLEDPDTGSLTAEQRDLLHRIQRNAETLLELISSTLDLGRLESGRDTVELAWVDLRELFADVADELAPAAQANGVAISWRRAGSSLFETRTDRAKLKTILKNLVGNAAKFAPNGRVEVVASGEAGTLTIEVSDDGIGIAPEDQAAIFEMFRQVDAASGRALGGVGLGLHIARRLAERLGGTIAVRSQPGLGSTFTVTLPVQFASQASVRPG